MAAPKSPPLSLIQAWWLQATGLAVLAPLSVHVPLWLTGLAGAALLWRGLLAWGNRPLPSRWLLAPLVLGGTGAVLAQYHTLFGQNAGIALLIQFLALKQLEARTARDGLVIILLAYFLALSQFFYSQAIPAALATAAGVLIATATLSCLADDRQRPRLLVRRAGLMLAQATPFMLVLFVLFPRIQGPLWGLPTDAHSGLTGLSDTMAPGSLSQLTLSDAIAFRVRFSGDLPRRQLLYWRGPVLSDFDGRNWRQLRELPRLQLPYAEPETGGIDYEITLEPDGKPWLFALELPGRPPADARATADYLLLAKGPVVARQRYALRSFPNLHAGLDESPSLLKHNLALPAGFNPRTRALAAGWHGSDEDILRQAVSFFRRQGLLYTLSPPLLGKHVADEFLFDSRQGFCEHFANAFVIAMRAAGVPARVVTGYQGGEINPVDGYLTVRQSDAHAWAEVWLAGRGWLRIDPTAVSAPTRIDQNLAAAVPLGDPLPFLIRTDLAWLRELRFRLDAVTNAWNQWVLGYNPQRQLDLLTRLGMQGPDWRSMTATLAVICGVLMLGLTAWTLRTHRRRDPATVLWMRLSNRLGRRGLARQPWEAPHPYAERVATALPETAADIRAIADTYCRLRYGAGAPHLLDELRRRVASFRP